MYSPIDATRNRPRFDEVDIILQMFFVLYFFSLFLVTFSILMAGMYMFYHQNENMCRYILIHSGQ